MDAINYLENRVKVSIINEVRDVAYYHSRIRNSKVGGHYSIPRSVFCYIDYLGYLAYGGKSTIRSIKFIKDFFPSNYHKYAELIYSMWRHGTVHQFEAISYYTSDKNGNKSQINIRWVSSIHNRKFERNQNIRVFLNKDTTNTISIVINTCQLADDLLLALDDFIKKLKNSNSLQLKCWKNIIKTISPQNYSTVKGKDLPSIVKDQIKLAWESKEGKIDNRGIITKFQNKLTDNLI